jgi:hypothetical protein
VTRSGVSARLPRSLQVARASSPSTRCFARWLGPLSAVHDTARRAQPGWAASRLPGASRQRRPGDHHRSHGRRAAKKDAPAGGDHAHGIGSMSGMDFQVLQLDARRTATASGRCRFGRIRKRKPRSDAGRFRGQAQAAAWRSDPAPSFRRHGLSEPKTTRCWPVRGWPTHDSSPLRPVGAGGEAAFSADQTCPELWSAHGAFVKVEAKLHSALCL